MEEKFKVQDVKKDPTFKKFLKRKSGLAQSSLDAYLYTIKSFCNFTGKSPTEIKDLHKNDLDARLPEYDMWLSEALDDYVSFLINNKAQAGGIKDKILKVKGFFSAFKLRPLPTVRVSKKQVKEDTKYALKREDIQKAVRNATPTYQTLIITQAQTGLSISDALLLDVEDFIHAVSKRGENFSIIENITLDEAIYRAKNDPNIIGCFDLRRKKTSNEFYTFAGPETLRNIAQLLESRDEYLKPNCPIFVKQTDYLPHAKIEKLLEDVRLIPNAAQNYFHRMHNPRNIFPQIEVDGKPKNFFRSHKLRKWFSNQVRFKAGLDRDDTKYLMGQKTGDVLEHYIDPNNFQSLKNNYRKAIPFLAINDEIVMEENLEAIEQIKKEKEELKNELIKQKEEHKAEMAEMHAKLESFETETNEGMDRLRKNIKDYKNLISPKKYVDEYL